MTRRASAHATSYRDGSQDWRMAAVCGDDPQGWDLDHVGAGTPEMWAAVRACQQCPVLADCAAWTATLTGTRKPKGLVQAGWIYPADGSRPYRHRPPPKHCKRGHPRTKANVTSGGQCRECFNAGRRGRQDAKRSTTQTDTLKEAS